MWRNHRSARAWLFTGMALACVACDGSAPLSREVRTRSEGAVQEEHVVVRYDFDGDDLADVLTLDVGRDPYRVVHALRARSSGAFVDASAAWAGRTIEPDLHVVLRTYLERSCAVGVETELEVWVRGQPLLVSVIE